MKLDLKPITKLDLVPIKKLDLKPVNQRIPFLGSTTDFNQMTPLGKTLDVVGRPGYAVKSGIKHAMEGENIGKGIEEGFTGQDRVLANDLWGKVGVKGIRGLGFASEMALDPLSYAGGAIGKVAGSGLGLVGKGLSKIPLPSKAKVVIDGLKNMFTTKSGIKDMVDLVDKHLGERSYLVGKEMKFSIKSRNVVNEVAKKRGVSPQEIEKELISIIELPDATSVSSELNALAGVIKTHFSDILTREMKAGVPISALSGGDRNIGYFPRIPTKQVAEILSKAKIGKSRIWNTNIENSLKRKTGDFTLTEWNDFVKTHGLESLGDNAVDNFFNPKATESMFIRGTRSAKAVTSGEFIQDVAKKFGVDYKLAPENFESLPEGVLKNLNYALGSDFSNLRFEPEILKEIGRVSEQYINPKVAGAFIQHIDNATNLWKRWSLSIFPKYHIRNEIGNLWNNYLAGVNPMKYNDAAALQGWRKFKGTGGINEKNALMHLDKIKLSPQQADEIIEKAEKLGVLNMGWYSKDIETPILQTLKSQKSLVGRGMAVGTTFENNSRLAHFLDKTSKGMSDTEAALSTKKYLFDYGDLTNFESQVLKRVFPFYTWTRKNIPLQVEQLITKPQKFVPLAYPLRQRNEQDLKKVREATPWLYEKMPLELGGEDGNKTYLPLEGFLPAADIGKLFRPSTGRSRTDFEKFVPGAEIAQELLHPIPKVLADLVYNKSMFTERDLQKYPGETQPIPILSKIHEKISFIPGDFPVSLQHIILSATPISRGLREIDTISRKNKQKEKLTGKEMLIQNLLGSVYKTNIDDLKEKSLRNIKRDRDDLMYGYRQAKKNGRKEEMKRIEKTMNELQKVISEVDK